MQEKTKYPIVWKHCHFTYDAINMVFNEEDEETYGDIMMEEQEENVFPGTNTIISPFGPLNVYDALSPLAQTDCWLAHTRFELTTPIIDELKRIPGVERLRILSRYRFLVGIGHCFTFSSVVEQINKRILGLEDDYKFIMAVFPNGKTEYSNANDPDFQDKVREIMEAKKACDGVKVFTS